MAVHSVRLTQGDMATFDDGRGSPTLLFVHGFPLNHEMWTAQLTFFGPRCRVIAPDLRGFGGSPAAKQPLTMEKCADDLDQLLAALGVADPVILVGLSMGGYVAFQFALRHGHRLRALVLAHTRAAADTPAQVAARHTLAERVVREQSPAAAEEAFLPKLLPPATLNGRPETVMAVRRLIRAASPEGIANALRGMAVRPDVTAHLPALAWPTLVVSGSADAISPPEEMRCLASSLRQGCYREIPEAGHLSPMETPERFNSVLAEFLANLN